MVADRRVGEQVRPVADGGNNQLFPARKLQPQRDRQGFAQAAGQRFLVIALGMDQPDKLRQRGQLRNDPAAVLIRQMAEAVAEPGFGNDPGLAGMEKRVALVFLLLDAVLRYAARSATCCWRAACSGRSASSSRLKTSSVSPARLMSAR